ncbi:hypothetical protein [Mycobacterium ulcerans]|uniref:hypothetical protein n=1 Tax=Mycobacterium ulcerans group TaxID=2993898 RepID=UPI00059D04A3|nr:hypothetical protein [Mycobacterium ulcerans]
MNHQADRGAHPDAGVQYVDGGAALGVEPVQSGCRTHARHDRPAHEYVECGQAAQQIRFLGRVDAMPYPHQAAVSDPNIELLAGHDRQQLRGRGEPAGFLQQRLGICGH